MLDADGSGVTEARYRRGDRCLWRRLGGEVYLARPGVAPARIEGAAAAAWLVLEEPGSAAEVLGRLAAAAPHVPPDGADHVDQAVALLAAGGWVVPA